MTEQQPEPKKKNWFLQHKLLSGIGAIVVIGIIVAAAVGGGGSDSETVSGESSASTHESNPTDPSSNASETVSSKTEAVTPPSSNTVPDETEAVVSTSTSASVDSSLKTQVFDGTGDDVIDLGSLSDPAVVTFECRSCSHNTTVKTDGDEGLLVNTIGEYSGSHFINLYDGTQTSRIVVGATGSWTLTVEDINAASDATAGTGDTALVIRSSASKAHITHDGEHNFAVKVMSLDTGTSDLAINTIGAYDGTVPFDAPAIVQITADGKWSMDLD